MYRKTIVPHINRLLRRICNGVREAASIGSYKVCIICLYPAVFQMSEESDSSTLKRDQTTQDFLTGLKEREELKSKLHDKERECNTLKGLMYDMKKNVEDLEKQVSKNLRLSL